MESFTITFTGTEPELRSVFFPPIELDGNYVIGLVDFQSYNALYNVKIPFNKFYYYKIEKIDIPKGETTISELNILFKDILKLRIDKNGILVNTKLKILFHKGFGAKINGNIIVQNNKIKIEEGETLYYYDPKNLNTIEIPEGTYEISEIVKEVQKQLPDFNLTADTVTMKATLLSQHHVFDFLKQGIGPSLLGFYGLSTPGIPYHSKNKVNINNVNVIRVKCNIANGSFLNGNKTHSIHSFYPQAPPGYKIIEVPRNIIYFPVNKRTLDVVSITFADQHDRPISFNGEETTITCHIKKI